jgi:hypothetical protein
LSGFSRGENFVSPVSFNSKRREPNMKYPIEDCETCIHNAVCKHIPMLEKLNKMKDKVPVYIDDECEDYASDEVYRAKEKSIAEEVVSKVKENLGSSFFPPLSGMIPLDNGEEESSLPEIHIHEADFDVDDNTILASVIRTVEHAIEQGHKVKGLAMSSKTLRKIAEEGQMDIEGAGGLPNLLATDTFQLPVAVSEQVPYGMVGLMCKQD